MNDCPNQPNATVHLGDCLEWLNTLPDASVDVVLTDPPYGMTDLAWDQIPALASLWTEFRRLLKPGKPAVVFAAQPFTTDLINSNRRWFKFCWVWRKRLPSGFANAKKRPLKETEDVVVFCSKAPPYYPQGLRRLKVPRRCDGRAKGGGAVGGDSFRSDYRQTHTGYPRNILEFPHDPRPNFHPTQKPVPLLSYLLKTHASPGAVVLDPFAGSGSTGVAAIHLGLSFIGCEISPDYHAVALRRINAAFSEREAA